MKKVSRYIKAISIFFQNYLMCILMKEVLIPSCEKGSPRISFLLFFICIRMVYSVFTSDLVLWNTIVKFMKVVLNSILIPSSEGVSLENFEK